MLLCTVHPSTATVEAVDVDVVVVGAGLSGLMVARTLLAEGVESVAVLEVTSCMGTLSCASCESLGLSAEEVAEPAER